MHADSTPALAAVKRFPQLYEQAAAALQAQQHRITERVSSSVARPDQLAALDQLAGSISAGVIVLEGAPGSGATTLLCQIAAARPAAIWLPGDDAGGGLEALCAQIIALHNLPVALVPPAASRDAVALERLLAEAVGHRSAEEPLLVLIDDLREARAAPLAPPFPLSLPAGVVVIAATARGAALPIRPLGRHTLPDTGDDLAAQIAASLCERGCALERANLIAARSSGSFLYARLAANLLAAGLLPAADLPEGLDALHERWWSALDQADRLALRLLAAAAEPLDLESLAALAGTRAGLLRGRSTRWRPMLEAGEALAFHHTATRNWIDARSGDALASVHAAYARVLHSPASGSWPLSEYRIWHTARHTALSDAQTRAQLAPALEQRAWTLAQERRTGAMRASALDAAWMLQIAARDGPPLRMVRAAALAGTLASLARSVHPDAIGAALAATIEAGGARDGALRRARAIVDQLADGRAKAPVLRRLGEVCYTLRMRAPAMRMLSEALDLEAQGLPRSWRDQREETLVALARAAIAHGAPNIALGITTLITHAERRGLIDTEVVRRLLAHGEFTRAEEVAYAISHAGTHEWAMAEVAVAWARAGDSARAEIVFATLRTETAAAWAATELSADAARAGHLHATRRVLALQNTGLRDRALAQVARAFGEGQAAPAFAAAAAISDPEIRARALIGVAEAEPQAAEQALAEAERAAALVTGDDRASLVAALAAAHAAAGWLDRALQTAELLPPGEEHDRVQSRIAVALARRGDDLAAHNVALGIQDDDERAWALDELARQVASAGRWIEAFGLAAQIGDAEQRAHTEADLAIAWARSDDPDSAHMRAAQIAHAGERLRALASIAAPLVAAGFSERLRPAIARTPTPDLRSRYQSAAAMAYAANGDLAKARALADQTGRPADRARALIALTLAAASLDRPLALEAFADALCQLARLGRAEALSGIAWAAEALVLLGGPELLLSVASALDELDGWWI